MKDYYYILGTARDASEEEVRIAYRKLSRKFHPDTNGGDEFYEQRFKDILEAYEVLSDENKRYEYNLMLLHSNSHSTNGHSSQPYWNKEEDGLGRQNGSITIFQTYKDKIEAIIANWFTSKKGAASETSSEPLKENRAFVIVKRLTLLGVILCGLFAFSTFTRLNSDVLKGITNKNLKEKVEENYKYFGIIKDQFEKGDYKEVSKYVEKINPELFYCTREKYQYEAVTIISYFKLGDWISLKKYEDKISNFEQLIDSIGYDSKSNSFMDLRGCNDEEGSEILIEEGIGEKIKKSLELKPDFLKLVGSEIAKDKDVQKKGFNQVAVYLQFNKKWRLSIFSKLIEIDSSISLSFYESEIERVAIEQLNYKYSDLEKKEGSKKLDISLIYDPYEVLAPINLKNGKSPFSKCFKEGVDKRNNSRLIIHNQYESDMVFLLKDIKSDQIIRNEYIKAGTNYKLRYIPKGEYQMIQIYGDCWIDKNDVKYSCGDEGMFTKDVWYAVPEKDNGIISIPQCGNSYTVKKAYLNPIVDGKLKVKFPDEKEIFN